MVERFVTTAGTLSISPGDTSVAGTGTVWSGRDREGARIVAYPASGVPIVVGTVAAVDPRGVYDNLTLPLVHAYQGDELIDVDYELVDGPAIANGTTQAAIYARFAAFLEQNMGLAGNLADDIDYSLVPNNTLFVDAVTRTIYQWRAGVLETVYSVGLAFTPKGAYDAGTSYAANDLVEYSGAVFVSNVAANLGHAPTVSPAPASSAYWTLIPLPATGERFAVSVFANSRPLSGEELGRQVFVTTVTFPAGLTGSRADVGAAATADAVFSLCRNDNEFGTVTFAAGETEGILAAPGETTFTAGDVLTILAPAPSDDSLANVAITLLGSRDGGAPAGQKGIASLDFGTFPGATDASVTVTGVGRIKADSIVSAWLWPGSGTDDHSADEHRIAGMDIRVSAVVAGAGFTLTGVSTEFGGAQAARHYGRWNVAWRWD